MSRRFAALKSCCFAALVMLPFASGRGEDEPDTGKLRISGFGSHETGQVVRGRHMNVDFAHQWMMREFANITSNYTANEHFRLTAGITARTWYEMYPDYKRNPFFPRKQYYAVYPSAASGVFSYGMGGFARFELEVGFFPFKYNADVRNLGEYLFRCSVYPPCVITNFDLTYSRLSGVRVSGTLKEMVHLQVLLTQENELPSFYDPSLAVIADVNFRKIFDVGAGVMFCRFWPIDSLATGKPSSASNYIDPVDSSSKTLTFKGIKMMSRFSFDPKRLLFADGHGIFGDNDLRLYGEVGLLGLKDYPIYYQDIKKRIPRMIGFNLPGFKVIDLAAFELEYYGWNYSNGYWSPVMEGTANPNMGSGDYSARDYNNDNWKWTVHMKKMFYRHFYILMQFANDHLTLPAYDERNYDRDEVCGRNSHWYWMTKFGVVF